MKKRANNLIIIATAFLAFSNSYAWETIDKIVAVVGDKVILSSELDFQLQLLTVQQGIKIESKEVAKKYKDQLLQQMINDRLILQKATADTTIKVAGDEIDEALNRRISDLKGRFGSDEEFEKQLETEGYNFRDLRMKLREEAREQIYKEKLINKLLSKVSVSRSDVEKFFSIYKDSLPDHPQSLKLAHCQLEISGSKAARDSLINLTHSLIDRAKAGESFEDLARKYSADPSAESGGDIGTVQKGDLMPEYEKAALALAPGEISDVVKTQIGYHIIKLIDKTEDQFHTEHILLLSRPSQGDSLRVMSLADSILSRLKAGEDFGFLVKEYSADSASRANFGEIGWFAIDELPEYFRSSVSDLAPGELSKPIWAPDGLHIVKVLERKDSRPYSLTEDFDIIKEYVRRQKTQTVISAVVDEMKNKVYVDLREY